MQKICIKTMLKETLLGHPRAWGNPVPRPHAASTYVKNIASSSLVGLAIKFTRRTLIFTPRRRRGIFLPAVRDASVNSSASSLIADSSAIPFSSGIINKEEALWLLLNCLRPIFSVAELGKRGLRSILYFAVSMVAYD